MTHEYKLVKLQVCPEMESTFNSLGASGWRLAGIGDGVAVFSRHVRRNPLPDVPRADPGRCEIEKVDGG